MSQEHDQQEMLRQHLAYLQQYYLNWIDRFYFENFNDLKANERRKLLTAHPELQITVPIDNLRHRMKYLGFYCNPYSSVARNMAIQGSDIDGGIVVVKNRNPSKENKFIKVLASAGFNVAHQDDPNATVFNKIKVYTEAEVVTDAARAILTAPNYEIITPLAFALAGHIIDAPGPLKRILF